jgi:hypothetical protein
MRNSEKRLRSVIREVIIENYMTDDGIRYSAHDDVAAELLRALQDKVFIADCLNQACEDVNNSTNPAGGRLPGVVKGAGITKENAMKLVCNSVMGSILSGLGNDLGSASRNTVRGQWSSEILGWLMRILYKADKSGQFSLKMPEKKSQIGWRFYDLTCQVSADDIPDVSSINDIR